jgi:acetylornithine/succinyldiaminopimelate/putrescine aminotransferase
VLEAGTHGSTFGGNPLACAAALAVLDTMINDSLPERALGMGRHFRGLLAKALGNLDTVAEIRGLGLMIGVRLTHPGANVVKECAAQGLLINCTMGDVLRILPPLTASESEFERATSILAKVLGEERSRVLATQSPESASGAPATIASGGKL